jgi:hypothetical protein
LVRQEAAMTSRTAGLSAPPPESIDGGSAPRRPSRYALPMVGLGAVLLTAIAVSGVGDAPDPHDPAAAVPAHFRAVRHAVLVAAPVGYLGAALLVAFVLGLARRIGRGGQDSSAVAAAVGGVLVGLYLVALHAAYTTLAYQPAAASAEASKLLFVATILAVPVLGLAVAVLLGAVGYGAWRSGLLPRWWAVFSAVGAVVAAVSVVSLGDSGFFSPDVQQQSVSDVLFLWVVLTVITLGIVERRAGRAAP